MPAKPAATLAEERLSRELAALLTGRPGAAPPPGDDPAELARRAIRHGVHGCLYHRYRGQASQQPLVAALQPRVQHDVATDIGRRQRLAEDLRDSAVISRFNPVVLKGEALAHWLYPAPWMRPRVDVDLLIAESDRAALIAAFAALGYRRARSFEGDLVLPQTTLRRPRDRLSPTFDIHWRFNNRPALAPLLQHDDLQSWTTIQTVGSHLMRVPDPVHSLLIACLHLVGHHAADLRLIWLYDIHLLAASLDDAGQQQFARHSARISQAHADCATALAWTRDYLPHARLDTLQRLLDTHPGRAPRQRSYLQRLLNDVRGLERGHRARFLAQHAFPPPAYMMTRFAIRHRWQLPYWYAARILRALPKLRHRR